MRVTRRRHSYTYGDYLLLEADVRPVRHEFIDGEIVAMATFMPSLREYVLVAQDEPLIEVRSLDQQGTWIARAYRLNQQATIGSIGATIDVDAIYREARKNAGG